MVKGVNLRGECRFSVREKLLRLSACRHDGERLLRSPESSANKCTKLSRSVHALPRNGHNFCTQNAGIFFCAKMNLFCRAMDEEPSKNPAGHHRGLRQKANGFVFRNVNCGFVRRLTSQTQIVCETMRPVTENHSDVDKSSVAGKPSVSGARRSTPETTTRGGRRRAP